MAETRKVIRAFLASPGDLQDERVAIRDVVREFNEIWADRLGYQVELMGWEETVAGYGRAQEIINQEVDRCDLFIGMMWKKWGTPPDNEGNFTSGFQEEYERCMQRRAETGHPEISMYFKQVPDGQLADPGMELQKVLEFKKRIIDGKLVLFQSFSEPQEVQGLVRKCVSQFVSRAKDSDLEIEEGADDAKPTQASSFDNNSIDIPEIRSPLSPEGYLFLEQFVGRVQHQEALSELQAVDIARFRLLSNSISREGNDERHVGVHDLNILFKNRNDLTLGATEVSALTRLGFQRQKTENVPLWHWYSRCQDSGLAGFCSLFGQSDDEKVGALNVLNWLGIDPSQSDSLDRDFFVSRWFSDSSSSAHRNAAIGYMTNSGTDSDLVYLRAEYERNDSATSRNALQGMISISSKYLGNEVASQLIVELQFDFMDANVLTEALAGFAELTTEQLRLGAKHRNARVRLRSLHQLDDRGELTDAGLLEFRDDNDAEVRFDALKVSVDRGQVFSESDVKKILVKPVKRQGFGLLSVASGNDLQGEENFEKFEIGRLRGLSERMLSDRLSELQLFDDRTYLALVDKYFSKWSENLRSNVDDQFASYFAERIERLATSLGEGASGETVKKAREVEDYCRKKLTRRGLDILYDKGDESDLPRARTNLDSEYVETSIEDARFLGKFGSWSDISLLSNSKLPVSGTGILSITVDDELAMEVARAAYRIGRSDVSRLFSLDLPDIVRTSLLSICAESVFKDVSDEVLFEMLNFKTDSIRKGASLLAVRSFPAKRIRKLLHEYVSADRYRYYNVIHWLDLGASMPRQTARSIARTVCEYAG